MTGHDIDVLTRKLAVIHQSVIALEAVRGMPLEDYRTDVWRRKGIERFLQEAFEAALDCAVHLVVRAGRPAPADLDSSFPAASELGVFDGAFARQLAPMVRLRNWLLHEYDELDDAKVHAALPQAVDDLTRFIAEVDAFLRTKP